MWTRLETQSLRLFFRRQEDSGLSLFACLTHAHARAQSMCSFVTSGVCSVQWSEKLEEVGDAAKKEELPLTVTVKQSTMHSIGEGVVTSQVHFNYTILNGSVAVLEVELDGCVAECSGAVSLAWLHSVIVLHECCCLGVLGCCRPDAPVGQARASDFSGRCSH